jgi:hypothetical protein
MEGSLGYEGLSSLRSHLFTAGGAYGSIAIRTVKPQRIRAHCSTTLTMKPLGNLIYTLITPVVMCSASVRAYSDDTPTGAAPERRSTIVVSYTGEAAANPIGGVKQGAAYAGRMTLDAHFVLPGVNGELRVTGTSRQGQELSQTAIGNNTSVQEIWGLQKTDLALVSYYGTYWNGRLDLEVGNNGWTHARRGCHRGWILRSSTHDSCDAPTLRNDARTSIEIPVIPRKARKH